MIARTWRGWAPREKADDYQRHYESEVAGHLQAVEGFRGARLLRQVDGEEVKFTSVVLFADMASVRGFAGENHDVAVVGEPARKVLSRWDERVEHHEVAAEITAADRPRSPA